MRDFPLFFFCLFVLAVSFPTRWKEEPSIIKNYFVADILVMGMSFFQHVRVCNIVSLGHKVKSIIP